MTDVNDLTDALAAGSSIVRKVDGGFVVDVPDPRSVHSYVSISVHRMGNGWTLSDGGITSFTSSVPLEALASHAQCAGLRLTIEDDQSISTAVPESARLAEAIGRFAAEVSGLPAMARLLQCAAPKKAREETSADRMAADTKRHLDTKFPVLAMRKAVVLRPDVMTGPVHVRPRLAVFRYGGRSRTPDVVCEFMNLRESQPTRAFSSAASTFLAYQFVPHRFLVADGSATDRDELRHLVERSNVKMVSTDDYGLLDEAVGHLV